MTPVLYPAPDHVNGPSTHPPRVTSLVSPVFYCLPYLMIMALCGSLAAREGGLGSLVKQLIKP